MKRPRAAALVFVIIGLAFFAIGASGQRTFLFVGIPFLVIGAVLAGKAKSSAAEPK